MSSLNVCCSGNISHALSTSINMDLAWLIQSVWDYRHTYAEHTAEIIKHWFVIVVVPGFWCIERDWNLYSWGRSQAAGTDCAKAPRPDVSQESPTTPLANPSDKIKDAWRGGVVPISGITRIHNTVYSINLPLFLQRLPILDMQVCLYVWCGTRQRPRLSSLSCHVFVMGLESGY